MTYTWKSYRKKKGGPNFMEHGVQYAVWLQSISTVWQRQWWRWWHG